MAIKCKIMAVNEAEHSIIVRYYSDAVPESALATFLNPADGSYETLEDGSPAHCVTDFNLTIYQVPAPATEAELYEYIWRNAPPNEAWFNLKEKIADPAVDTSLSVARTAKGRQKEFIKPQPIAAPKGKAPVAP